MNEMKIVEKAKSLKDCARMYFNNEFYDVNRDQLIDNWLSTKYGNSHFEGESGFIRLCKASRSFDTYLLALKKEQYMKENNIVLEENERLILRTKRY